LVFYLIEPRESNLSVNQIAVPRSDSPPVPALVKKMSESSPAPVSIGQSSDLAVNRNGRNDAVPNGFRPSAPREIEPSSDTKAVLEQLAAIQRVWFIYF
jgi:hypothetical protein